MQFDYCGLSFPTKERNANGATDYAIFFVYPFREIRFRAKPAALDCKNILFILYETFD